MTEIALWKSVNNGDSGGGHPLSHHAGPPTAKFGLWVFMGVVTTLFSLLMSAYYMRMQLADWNPMPDPWQLWLNTALLILSSASLQWAVVSARRGQIDKLKIGLLAGGILAFAFLAGQFWAWEKLSALNFFAASNPANSFFYLITALHGLHLIGGLVAWGRTAVKAWRGVEMRLSVELTAIYWHFLLAVWLVMFALLLFADLGPKIWSPLIC